MAVAQPMARRAHKPETAYQWNRALDRAINEALDVLTEPTSGQTFVESAVHPGIPYRVTPESCTCTAGQRGIPCKHQACLLAQMGMLPLDSDPAPVAPTVSRVITPTGTLYSEHTSEQDAIDSLNWLLRCYGAGGAYVVKVAA